jgi:hypothetical protein
MIFHFITPYIIAGRPLPGGLCNPTSVMGNTKEAATIHLRPICFDISRCSDNSLMVTSLLRNNSVIISALVMTSLDIILLSPSALRQSQNQLLGLSIYSERQTPDGVHYGPFYNEPQ